MENKGYKTNQNNKNKEVEINNDQLGENASEEFKSEEYSNAVNKKSRNGNMK
jgi:hypothetical protein